MRTQASSQDKHKNLKQERNVHVNKKAKDTNKKKQMTPNYL